jgi:hypothetical protein
LAQIIRFLGIPEKDITVWIPKARVKNDDEVLRQKKKSHIESDLAFDIQKTNDTVKVILVSQTENCFGMGKG